MPAAMPAAMLAVMLAAMAGCAAGCAAGGTGDAAGAGPTTVLSRPAAPPGPGLFVVNSQPLGGPIVIDGQGYLMYRYDRDGAAPPRSACTGACAAEWPPVRAGDLARLRVAGIDRGKLGVLRRPDGIGQLTLAGHPLYGRRADRLPGDTSGHGRDGWFAVSPAGARAGRPPG
ncbi:COG4315 family predicted lipoprotein [Sphaerisporangium rufum]|nr:hypothetical protein [Sphaerisporangium rufum]